MQLTHDHHKASTHNKEIILVCDNITSPANAGSLFRLADAFGVKEMIFCGLSPDFSSSRLRKTARNTEKIVTYKIADTTIAILKHLHEQNYQSIALEISAKSQPILEVSKTVAQKILLVIGNERNGIAPETLNTCQKIVHIPMFGVNSSMNVAQATGIALYELTKS